MYSKIRFYWSIVSKSKEILRETPEEWINFSAGQNTKPHFARLMQPPKARGIAGRILIFCRWLISSLVLRKATDDKTNTVLVYIDSLNQYSVLCDTVQYLNENGIDAEGIYKLPKNKESNLETDWRPIEFDAIDVFLGLLIAANRINDLYRRLTYKDKRLINYRFDSFLQIYIYIPWAIRYLIKYRPKIVLVANDHNPSTRALILASNHLDIETAYVQHAAVSTRFHELQFAHSFLDGEYSIDAYNICEGRRAPNTYKKKKRMVYVSGFKRTIKSALSRPSDVLGICFKESDGVDSLLETIERLPENIKSVEIRLHPATSQTTLDVLSRKIDTHKNIRVTCASEIKLNDYLNSISILLGGNSTMHLEAALAGVPSIYYGFKGQLVDDYYCFARRGVCMEAKSREELIVLLQNSESYIYKPPMEAIKYYSSSYGTRHQGSEQKYVANLIKKILTGIDPEKIKGGKVFNPK